MGLSKLNPDNTDELAIVQSAADEISELLSLHLHSEEAHVLPPLEARVPGSTKENHADHVEMERLEKSMVQAINEIKDYPSADKAYQSVNMFIREYFRHMDEEETQMNQVIWEHFTDQEILEWQGKILSELTPEQFGKWFKYIIPALTPMEQSIMLGGFKENAAAEVYSGVINELQPFLTESQKLHVQTI